MIFPFMGYSLENGVYEIQNAANRDYVIDNNGSNLSEGNNIHLWLKNGTNAQRWYLYNNSDGTVSLRSTSGDDDSFFEFLFRPYYMMDLNGSNATNGNNIHLWTSNSTNAQKWFLTRNSNGSYTIRSAVNRNFVIDNNACNLANGNNIQIWESNGTKAQQWYFVKIK